MISANWQNYTKNHISWLTKELIYGAHLTALISPAFIITVSTLQNIKINYISLIIAYLIPLIVYSYNYQKELDNDAITDPDKVNYLRKKEKVFSLILGLYIALLIILTIVSANYGFFVFMIIILTGGILYTIVFKVLTKTIPGFKSIYVTMIWAYAGTFYVVFLNSLEFTTFYVIIFLFIFLKMLINVVFFDIKDINRDRMEQLKTLPILIGKLNTITLLNILNILALILLIYSIYINILPLYASSLSLFFIYTLYYVNKGKSASEKELLKYTYVLADAEFVLWPVVLIIGKIIIGV